jgi:4-hydroxy-tetrahydrodipicolinate synthase
MLLGGHGNVSVTANVAPRGMAQLCEAAMAREADAARALDARLAGLYDFLGVEPNPIPVKWALVGMGKCGGTLRLPLTPLSDGAQSTVKAALREAGVL